MKLYHHSDVADLDTKGIDPKFHGTGTSGNERKRMALPDYQQRSYFYNTPDTPEPRLKSKAYRYEHDEPDEGIYDLHTDKDNLKAGAMWGNHVDLNSYENAVKQKGYKGFTNSGHELGRHVVALFNAIKPKKSPMAKAKMPAQAQATSRWGDQVDPSHFAIHQDTQNPRDWMLQAKAGPLSQRKAGDGSSKTFYYFSHHPEMNAYGAKHASSEDADLHRHLFNKVLAPFLSKEPEHAGNPPTYEGITNQGAIRSEGKPNPYYDQNSNWTGKPQTKKEGTVNQLSVKKSEDLAKGKNQKEQRKAVFGDKAQPERTSEHRVKTMRNIKNFVQRHMGLKLETAAGKIDEATGELKTPLKDLPYNEQPYDIYTDKGVKEEKARLAQIKAENEARGPAPAAKGASSAEKNIERRKNKAEGKTAVRRVDHKPDWRSGNLQTQPSPDAAVHEVAHIMTAKDNQGLGETQTDMDREFGAAIKNHGFLTQKRTQGEIQPMAAENKMRRLMGLPANRQFINPKPMSEHDRPVEQAIDQPTPRFVRGKAGDKSVDLMRQARLLNPRNAEQIDKFKRGEIEFDKEKGWQPRTDINAKINQRARAIVNDPNPETQFARKDRDTLMRSEDEGNLMKSETYNDQVNKRAKEIKDAAKDKKEPSMPDQIAKIKKDYGLHKSIAGLGGHLGHMLKCMRGPSAPMDKSGHQPHPGPSIPDWAQKVYSTPEKKQPQQPAPKPMEKTGQPPHELWQMTRAEYDAKHGKPKKNNTVTGGFHPHASAVETAVNRGHPVPQHVLADYPHLAPKPIEKSWPVPGMVPPSGDKSKLSHSLKKMTESLRGGKLEKDMGTMAGFKGTK